MSDKQLTVKEMLTLKGVCLEKFNRLTKEWQVIRLSLIKKENAKKESEYKVTMTYNDVILYLMDTTEYPTKSLKELGYRLHCRHFKNTKQQMDRVYE